MDDQNPKTEDNIKSKTAEENLKSPKKDKSHKKILIIVSAIFLIIGLIYLFYWIFIARFYETTDDAYVNGNQIQVMSQITGHVTTIHADETDLVKKGETLVTLDNADAIIALKTAEENLALTTRQVNQLYQNVAKYQADVEEKQADLVKAKEDYQRRQGLVVNKTISQEDFRHAKIAVDTATDSLASAQHQLDGALTLVGNTDLYHHPQVQQAITNLRNAYLTFERTIIYSPATGYVAKRFVQVGQEVNPNTVLMIVIPLNQIWVDANFKESQLKNIRINQPAELISDAYGSDVKFQGKVMGLSPGTGSAFDLLPPQNATGNWIKIVQRLPVRIIIDPKQLEKYPLRMGLSVSVSVDTHKRDGETLQKVLNQKVIYETKDYSSDLKKADTVINKILQENAKNTSIQTLPQQQ